ncbi:Non-specific serine/threonine protein kinase [Kluyveromyces marxianus]|uniref:Serine/threonine-protein kinase RIO2 n=2 Tax=Kluyveromyces marxianus TaxID=4911 RepID=W0TCU4_KLUMD|nr:serine/threonine-protein kinase RIO2 [Kluyveromyces marxianus DMKU3-1042]KAG0678168.1 Serine kinase [Kluyveromyces marxianus]KAG0685428.1 Serine kinase [Kluyveromyces marxianus]QGN16951.1 serine/threonine-protein kinase RIO2 [Kluyveromyces marxianus]BAO41245.1 serine/threonine-protein kinase RIO2 [Kluyveromyces marxianus DMKU3-1042]
MKLDTSHMRYLTAEDFRVLQAVEQGSRNHEVVPTHLIHTLSGMRSMSGTNRSISDLAKLSLISKLRNSKYDGYRLTYNGFDYLALRAMLNRDTVYSVGTKIGVGKESDIYQVSDRNGEPKVLKMHRLGRTSFHTVKNNREYLRSGQSASWMHLSKLAANKEYQFMTLLYNKDFEVPQPFDNSRHCVLMELIKGYPMRRLGKHKNLPKLYSDLMSFIVRLANHGLIHCDFNEFNIMIKDEVENENDPGYVVIDFPQCISIQHQDAAYYFKRDVDCIRRFFKKKLKYEPKEDATFLDTDGFGDGFKYPYPVFERDVKRCDNLDELVMASGFTKKHPGDRDLELAVQSMRDEEYTEERENEENSDYTSTSESEYSDFSDEESSENESEEDDENERIIQAISSGVENLKIDKFGNYILED